MARLQETVNLKLNPDTVTDRIAATLDRAKQRGRGFGSACNKRWYVGGFMLEELGGGILGAFIAMEDRGELDGMTATQKKSVLIKLLSTEFEPVPTPTPTPTPTPRATPEHSGGLIDYGQ